MQRRSFSFHDDSGQNFGQYFDTSRGRRQASPETLFPVEVFVEGEVRRLNEVASSVRASLAAFPKKVYEARREIEDWTRCLSRAAFAREQALKAYLQEMGTSKMLSWDRQLKICHEAMEWLKKVDDGDPGKTPDDLIAACDAFTKRLGFVEVGAVELDEEDLAEPKSLSQTSGIICVAGTPAEDRAFGSERYAPRLMFGGSGDSAGKLCRPWGVCSDLTNRIFVADSGNNRIQVFSEDGKFIFQFGKEGSRLGEFSWPTGVAVDKKGRIIVADKGNHRVQVFSFDGAFLFRFGRHGSRNGQFNCPWGVAADEECRIAVSDSKNHRVQLFNERGVFLAKFGHGEPLSERLINCPRGVAFAPDGSLLITDFNSWSVLIVEKDSKKARRFGNAGASLKPFSRPQGVACDASGRCAFSESNNYRILVLDEEENLCQVFGAQGKGPGEFECPQGVCFQPNGSIVVADSERNLIQVF